MLNDKQPVIYGDGEQSRDFTYIDNVVGCNILASTVENIKNVSVNCACHGQITLNQLVNDINKILGKNIKPIYSSSVPGDIKHSFADIQKAKQLFNYEPVIDFQNGLKKTISWFDSSK